MQGETDDSGKVTAQPTAKTLSGLVVKSPTELDVTLTGPFAGFSTMLGYTGFFPSTGSFQQGDPKINSLLDGARGEFDDKKRIAAIQEVQKIVADQQYIVRFPGTSNGFSLSWPATRNVEVSKGDLTLVGEWLDPTKAPINKPA